MSLLTLRCCSVCVSREVGVGMGKGDGVSSTLPQVPLACRLDASNGLFFFLSSGFFSIFSYKAALHFQRCLTNWVRGKEERKHTP